MAANDRQVRRLFRAHGRWRDTTKSALAAGMCRQTAAKYLRAGCLPSELARPHTWRTRPDPFAAVRTELVGMLQTVPNLPASAALAHLQAFHPGRFADGQLRTLQRQFRQSRARTVAREVFFAQEHVPGEWLQIDWTSGAELGVTVRGEPFAHLLAHAVFPFSNWEWACVCQSENFASLVALVRETANRAGGLPGGLQTDNSSTVSHRVGSARAFNDPYAGFLARYGLQARTINLRSPQENGDVESAHRHCLVQVGVALGFRGSRDFDSQADYGRFLARLLCGRNATRQAAWAQEQSRLRPLPAGGLPDWDEQDRRVDSGSLVTVDGHVYSVPPSYIGERLCCRVGWERIELLHGRDAIRVTDRVWGEEQGVEWRDLVVALRRKPGAFAAYRYRDAFFPTAEMRELYGQLEAAAGPESAGREWVELLAAAREVPDARLPAVLAELLAPPMPSSSCQRGRGTEVPPSLVWCPNVGGGSTRRPLDKPLIGRNFRVPDSRKLLLWATALLVLVVVLVVDRHSDPSRTTFFPPSGGTRTRTRTRGQQPHFPRTSSFRGDRSGCLNLMALLAPPRTPAAPGTYAADRGVAATATGPPALTP